MANEGVYSAGGESNKRKYEDSPPTVGRRATGFSSGPDSAAPPAAYNSVPPPLNEIELAKQKAQEIAARLLNTADPSKRARVENGAGVGGGYDSIDSGVGQKHSGLGYGAPPQSASYGYPGPTKKIDIPNGRVGVIIGKGGETIKYLQQQSGAKIQVTRDMDADPNSATRPVELMGTPDQIAKAEQMINDVLSEAESGGSGIISRRVTGQPSGAEQFVMKVPNNKVGLVIGKGGETIKNMQASTGARIQVIPLHLPPGDTSKERTVQIDGTSEQIEAAKQLVEEVISENRMRNQSMSGGYSQQGYQSRPQSNWGPSGQPMQQPSYGYVQPGAYPGPLQYNQPPYPGYPPQPTSGGYSASWDQSSATQNPPQGGGYDYYNQQAPAQQQSSHAVSSAPTDGSAYSYTQAPTYSQGYDGYGGYHTGAAQSGYSQPTASAGAGYDQQQGYGSAYGNAPNPTPDGQTLSYGTTQGDPTQPVAPSPAPGQSYSAGGQPSPNPSYPSAQAPQPGYGVPPSSQGGYGAQPPPSYAGYGAPQAPKPGTQLAYAQTDSGAAQRPLYPASQPGYGAPPYGAPPTAAPTGYGQQQAPQYGSAGYGGGYSQPAAYSSDVSGGNARGAYDATPPQPGQPAGAAKASPPS